MSDEAPEDQKPDDYEMVGEAGPVLEPEEIDALMASMAPDEQAEAMFAALPPLTQPESVEPYEFSSGDDNNGPGRYPLFVNVQERLAEALNEQWSDIFKREISTPAQGMSQKKYLEIISETKPQVYFAYAAEGYGRMMVTFETSLIIAYVDAMLGGAGESYGEISESLSPVETRLSERIAKGIAKMLAEAWKPICVMDFELFKLDTDPQFLSVAGGSDSCFSMDFEITLGESGGEDVKGIFSLHYPRPFLEPVLDSLRTTVSDDAVVVDEAWENELGQAIESIPLSLRVVLGECVMDISHFLKLSPGDLLPLSKGEQEISVLWAGSMPMFNVMVGSQDGQLAIEIMDEIHHGGRS